MRTLKIVVIGGGTGTFELLSGLKKYHLDLTALVSMADDGGSTGLLRDEYGVLPPGDMRKALVALARAPEMRDLFNYRYEEGSLAGHTFGNLFLSTVEKIAGNDFGRAIALAGKVLNITGRVVPVTLDKVTLVLEEADGRLIRGESSLDKGVTFQTKRPKVRLEPTARITREGKEAILAADLVVIAPGSLYGSLGAALVVEGVAEALAKTKAKKIFVCNLVTEYGQTDGFMVHDYAAEIERFLGGAKLDCVLYNTRKPAAGLLDRYYAEEHRTWVGYDRAKLAKRHYEAIGGGFLYDELKHGTVFIRHDRNKIAKAVLSLKTNRGKVDK